MNGIEAKKHYNYIDRLKGVAITLVVMGHMILVVFGNNDCNAFKFIGTVHMPLFMFLSGLVISKGPSTRRLIEMLFRFLCPFLIVGGLLTLYCGDSLLTLFTRFHKNGYWYLYILSLFYVFLYIKEICKLECWAKRKWLVDIVFFFLLYLVFWICYLNLYSSTNDIIGIGQCKSFWPYFFLGHMTNKYKLERYAGNTGYTICIIIFIFSTYYFLNGMIHLANLFALSFIFVVFSLFREREECSTRTEEYLQKIGKSSLDVYIYHYFLYGLITLPTVGSYLLETNNQIIFILLLFVVSVVNIIISLIIGKIVKKSSVLYDIVYGRMIYKWI